MFIVTGATGRLGSQIVDRLLERLRVAVDGAFARWDDAVRGDSEIAFIPPVSGG